MTDVVKNKTTRISNVADALPLFQPPPREFTGKTGLEVEMALYRAGATKPEIPTSDDMLSMHGALKQKGHDAQLEAAGVLEYASPPAALDNLAPLVARVKADLQAFENEAAERGYSRAPYSILPTTTVDDAMENRVPRERLEASLNVIETALNPRLNRIPLLTTGVQTSFSPKDSDEMFRMAHRGYALTPLLIAAMNSTAGYVENDDTRLTHHPRGKFYEMYGTSGGLSPAFLKSANPQEFVARHIDAVFDAPMFFAYDADDTLIRSTKDDVLTFRKLIDRGLNTQSNFELAETFLYNDIKVCNLRDETGNVVGKRLEVRAADSGLHQPVSTLLLTAALVPEGETGRKFDALLKEYGFTGVPVQDAALLQSAREAAVNHGGKFMDVAFGKDPQTGAARSLREFAADVAGLVVNHYGRDKALAADVSVLADVLLSGECDAKRFAAQYRSLAEVNADLQQTPAPRAAAAKPAALRL